MTRLATPPLLLLLTLLASLAGADTPADALGGAYAGWRPSRHAASWVVEGDVLHAANDPAREGSTLWTTRPYTDFALRLEFRFGPGTVDSGVFVRHETDQIQIGQSGSLKRDMTGSPYIVGKGYPVEAEGVAETLRGDDWNAMLIVAVGRRYDVWLNGVHVMNYASDTAAVSGPVGLQVHPNRAMRIDFRRVRVIDLASE